MESCSVGAEKEGIRLLVALTASTEEIASGTELVNFFARTLTACSSLEFAAQLLLIAQASAFLGTGKLESQYSLPLPKLLADGSSESLALRLRMFGTVDEVARKFGVDIAEPVSGPAGNWALYI